MQNTKSTTRILTFCAICAAVNFVGGLTALTLRLPVYLDSIGTILAAIVLGPFYVMLTGLATSIINAALFDPISIWFTPVQLLVALFTGLMFKDHRFHGFRSVLSIILITVCGSMLSAAIAGYVFDGVTSSGSSLIVAFLKNSGMNVITAVFSTQIITDLADRAISFGLSFAAIKAMPKTYLLALESSAKKRKWLHENSENSLN
ncbi:MAG: ECF transporter S component [Eubacteriaceae bacterium]|jgi:energy-coupling factor transport system substrate-specific component